MRRMCGLSSQIRNRSLLKSMRYMVGPDAAEKQYTGVNHIAAPVKESLQDGSIGGVRTPDGATFFEQEPVRSLSGGHRSVVRPRTARAGSVPRGCGRDRTASA